MSTSTQTTQSTQTISWQCFSKVRITNLKNRIFSTLVNVHYSNVKHFYKILLNSLVPSCRYVSLGISLEHLMKICYCTESKRSKGISRDPVNISDGELCSNSLRSKAVNPFMHNVVKWPNLL